ncbi:TRASH domain-containing protein, partial [Haematococcus lacustris]
VKDGVKDHSLPLQRPQDLPWQGNPEAAQEGPDVKDGVKDHSLPLQRPQDLPWQGNPCKSLYNNRLRPAKLAWTVAYRKQHKKDQVSEVQRKKRRNLNKSAARSIVGASLEVINKRRTEKPEVRQASRDAALREVKERAKKAKAEKVAKQGAPKPQAKQQQQKANVVGRGKR